MRAARVLLSPILAGCIHLAACGSFGSADAPAGADAGDAAAADGDLSTVRDGGGTDGPQPACTALAITDDFPQGFPGWDLNEASGLVVSETMARSVPTALLLELAPGTTTRSFLGRKLPRCRIAVSIWMRVQGGFGDGEVDFVGVTDSLDKNFDGVLVISAKAQADALSVEDPAGGQRRTNAPVDTWFEVKLDVDPIQHRYEASVAGEPFGGPLPSTFGAGDGLYLLVGAPWVDSGRTKPWKVSFDDLTVKVVP